MNFKPSLWWFSGLTAAAVVWWSVRALDRAHVADWGGYGINLLDGLNRIFCRRFHRLVADPLPLPAQGGAIVVANHLSGLDPLLLAAASKRPLRFLIAEEEYNRWWLRWLFRWIGCIPVDRSARGTRAFYRARAALERGEVLALFPQGRIHDPAQPPVVLNRGFLELAKMTTAPVLPVRIAGVKGVGQTVSAVFRRSQARLASAMPLTVREHGERTVLARTDDFIQSRS